MSFLLFHLASIFIISQRTVADLDFFSTDDFNAPFLPIPDYQEPIPSEDIFQDPTFNEDPFLNPDPSADDHSETILFNDNPVNIDLISSSSSCPEEKNLPSKLRSRSGATCPSEPVVPDLSNLLNTINLEPTPETYVITNPIDRAESLEIAQFYCSPFTSLPRLFILPVCSTPSSVYTPVMGGYYAKIKYSKLLFLRNLYECPHLRVFCCMAWLPDFTYDYVNEQDQYSGEGTGYNCENLKARGWDSGFL